MEPGYSTATEYTVCSVSPLPVFAAAGRQQLYSKRTAFEDNRRTAIEQREDS